MTPPFMPVAGNYQQAMRSMYGMPASGLDAPFYPMLYSALGQSLTNAGMDPFGQAIRETRPEPPKSQPEIMWDAWQQRKSNEDMQQKISDDWRQRTGSPSRQQESALWQQTMAGMSPANQKMYSMLMSHT